MRLLDSLVVDYQGQQRRIELYHGDLTAMEPQDAVDVLVVSAFPDDYSTVRRSLIGALDEKGISVAALAERREVDLRQICSCWMSRELADRPAGIQFRRILCFEPLVKGEPPEVVGDIFRSLMPFATADPPLRSIAMPLVTAGFQQVPVADILEPLLDAALHWFSLGLPLERMKIVEIDELRAAEMRGAFAVLKRHISKTRAQWTPEFAYDLFISYSHENKDAVDFLVQELKRARPGLRIFLDRLELKPGAAWQRNIFEALDNCRKVVTVYSPHYLMSKVCQEEFNIALLRHREAQESVLVPIYLHSAKLPGYMRTLQYTDCREANRQRLRAACQEILAQLA